MGALARLGKTRQESFRTCFGVEFVLDVVDGSAPQTDNYKDMISLYFVNEFNAKRVKGLRSKSRPGDADQGRRHRTEDGASSAARA
jgi:hypothetical protein